MSIRQILNDSERKQISGRDRRTLQRMLKERGVLNRLLNKPVNSRLLGELQCLLDKQPLPRQESGRVIRGQITRLSDGNRYPCYVRKMTPEERIQYGVDKP